MYDLAIIGGGPAGISLIAEAIEAGVDKNKIVIFEKSDKESWVIRKLYPEQKLVTANYKGQEPVSLGVMKFHDMGKEETISVLKNTIEKYDAEILFNRDVSLVEKVGEIFHLTVNGEIVKAKTCAIAIGVFGKPRQPSYKITGKLRKLTAFDITSTDIRDSKVLVVGGGDSSSEYAQHLYQKNNELAVAVRSNHLNRMNEENQEALLNMQKNNQARVLMETDIDSLEETEGKVLVNFKNLEAELFDRVIYALGGTTPTNFLKVIGIDFDGKIPSLTENYETSIEGLYLIGDLGSGKKGGAIIHAFNSSHLAMKSIKTKLP